MDERSLPPSFICEIITMSDSTPSHAATRHSTRISATVHVTATFLRRQIWAWPILAAVVFGGVGLWVHSAVETAMQEQRRDSLMTVLDAEATSIHTWMSEQR